MSELEVELLISHLSLLPCQSSQMIFAECERHVLSDYLLFIVRLDPPAHPQGMLIAQKITADISFQRAIGGLAAYCKTSAPQLLVKIGTLSPVMIRMPSWVRETISDVDTVNGQTLQAPTRYLH